MDNLLGLTSPAPLSLTALAINLLLSILLSSALAWYYARYGRSLSNRARFAQTLPVLTLATVLIISIVKSSLALSLGLVGALSIVRFRTAIKEPEELLYLFLAIAVGLGLGADQRWPTIVATLIILGYLLARASLTLRPTRNNLYLNILTSPTDESGDNAFATINQVLLKHVKSANLRRLDRNGTTLQATYLVECEDESKLIALMDDANLRFPGCELSFVEQDSTLGG